MSATVADAHGASPGEALKAGAKAGVASYIGQVAGGANRGGNAYGGNLFEEAVIQGVAYGAGSEITGGQFQDGFKMGFGGRYLQAGIEAFTTQPGTRNNEMTWESGEGYTQFKPAGMDYVDGAKSNIGIGCRTLGGCAINGKIPWDHEGSSFRFCQNSPTY